MATDPFGGPATAPAPKIIYTLTPTAAPRLRNWPAKLRSAGLLSSQAPRDRLAAGSSRSGRLQLLSQRAVDNNFLGSVRGGAHIDILDRPGILSPEAAPTPA
jgi:hypothetical protein